MEAAFKQYKKPLAIGVGTAFGVGLGVSASHQIRRGLAYRAYDQVILKPFEAMMRFRKALSLENPDDQLYVLGQSERKLRQAVRAADRAIAYFSKQKSPEGQEKLVRALHYKK
jgi:hypothetical protein